MSTTTKQKQSVSYEDSCGHVAIKTPRATGYDPLTADEGVGPLFWELLRRHPGFRFRHRQLESILNREKLEFNPAKKAKPAPGQPDGTPGHPCVKAVPEHAKRARFSKPLVLVSRYVFRLATWNPLAALVMAWSFRGRPFLLRWPTPEAWSNSLLTEYLTRSLQVRQLTKNSPAWTVLYAEEVGRPEDRMVSAQDPGPGSFILDRAWNELPVRLRAYFSWLAEEYDHRLNWVREHVIGIDGFGWWPPAGLYTPRVDWAFINNALQVDQSAPSRRLAVSQIPWFELESLGDTFAAYHLFLIPKQLPSKVEVNKLKDSFKAALDRLFADEHGLAVCSNDRNPYGASTDWKVLDYCRARIEYTRASPDALGPQLRNISTGYQRFQPTLNTAFKDLENKLAKDGKVPSHRQTPIKKAYSRMEAEMLMTFPHFSLEPCLVEHLGLDQAVVRRFSERARRVAGLKLFHLTLAPMGKSG